MNYTEQAKSTTLNVFKFKNVSIRTFWITAVSFFMCFFAWFDIVPFIDKKVIGSVSGIVEVGGDVDVFLAAMLMKLQLAVADKSAILVNQDLGEEIIKAAQSAASATAVSSGYFIIGTIVVVTAVVSLAIQFSAEYEKVAIMDSHVNVDDLIPIKVKS